MYGYIYKTTNLITGKIYIGQKKSKKFKGDSYLGSGKKLKDAIKKYGKENFKVDLIEEVDCLEKMDEREIYWISQYNSTNKDIGYNMSNGGNVNRALSGENHPLYHKGHTLESRKKMSESHKGVPLSKEHIQRCVESRKGYHHSEDTKRKISNGNKNKIVSEETRLKISQRNKGHVPWNKGLTKEDVRVAKYTNNRKNNYIVSNETRLKLSLSHLGQNKGLIWVNNGTKNKRISEDDLSEFESVGWCRGKLPHTQETLNKMRGHKLSKETRKKISKTETATKREVCS